MSNKVIKLTTKKQLLNMSQNAADFFEFDVTDKRSGKTKTISFRGYEGYGEIAGFFVQAVHGLRFTHEYSTLNGIHYAVKHFLDYLFTDEKSKKKPQHISDITGKTLKHYAQWLKRYSDEAYQTSAKDFSRLTAVVNWLNIHIDATSPELRMPEGMFPRADSLGENKKTYTNGKSII